MTKQEFLNKLSHEELLLLRDMVSSYDVATELKKRNTETLVEIKAGDCFIYINDYDGISLTKVSGCNPEDQYFDCKEISIDSDDIDSYEVNYWIGDFSEHDRINSEIFDKIATIVNSRDYAINEIRKEFDEQIRELCSTLLNTQNKN